MLLFLIFVVDFNFHHFPLYCYYRQFLTVFSIAVTRASEASIKRSLFSVKNLPEPYT